MFSMTQPYPNIRRVTQAESLAVALPYIGYITILCICNLGQSSLNDKCTIWLLIDDLSVNCLKVYTFLKVM